MISSRRGRRDSTQYPILENDNKYTDWIIKITRQFKSEECDRLIDSSFEDNQEIGAANIDLFQVQINNMSVILERVLKTTGGIRLSKKYHDNPWKLWRLYEQHQRASATSARITTSLSQELANMKVAEFPSPTKCLDMFDS